MKTKPLWEETRDLHHACEQHTVGGSMASGKPPRVWYAAWLKALYQIHVYIDRYAPKEIHRALPLVIDFQEMNIPIIEINAATTYVDDMINNHTSQKVDGAIYVLTGAHLMGGEIMRRRLEGYPVKHLEWNDRKSAIAILQTYRTRNDITTEARDCFQALLNIMDEIEQRFPKF